MSCKETAYLTGRSSIESYETRNVALAWHRAINSPTLSLSFILLILLVLLMLVSSAFCYVNRLAHTEFNSKIHKTVWL